MVRCLAQLAPDIIASGSFDYTVRIWDVSFEASCLHILRGHKDVVRVMRVVSPFREPVVGTGDEGHPGILATASQDETIRLWRWRTGDCVKILRGHSDHVTCMAVGQW